MIHRRQSREMQEAGKLAASLQGSWDGVWFFRDCWNAMDLGSKLARPRRQIDSQAAG